MENILLPSKINYKKGAEENEMILVLEPCYCGYGTTLGNALRRVLLSSLPGASVTGVKIKGVQHEFSTIPHVKEDVLEIVLNLKLLRLRIFTDEPVRLKLKVSGEQKVSAKDFESLADVLIVNPELHLATLTDKKAELDMEVFAEKGRGYVTAEEHRKGLTELGTIAIDAAFSPVISAGVRVENVRVGQITNYDKLILTILTNGIISPQEAVEQASKILIDHLTLLTAKETETKEEGKKEKPKKKVVKKGVKKEKKEEKKEKKIKK